MDAMRQKSLKYARKESVSAACIAFCILIIIIFGFLYIMPEMMVTLLKPIFLIACFLAFFIRYYRIGCFRPLVYLAIYYVVILIGHEMTDTALSTFVSLELFLAFFFFAGLRHWGAREIVWILRTLCIGCAIQAAIVLRSNPGLLGSSGGKYVLYLGVKVNRNTPAFGIAPGGVSGMFLYFFDNRFGKVKFRRLIYLACAAFCTFTVLALGCRSAFYAMAGGLLIMYWMETASTTSKRKRRRKRVMLILGIVLVYLLAITVTKGSYSARLLQFGDDFDGSGREDIWKVTWEQIMKTPYFGDGFDNWPPGLKIGTHNSFLTIMLYGGFVAAFFVALSFLMCIVESLKCRNLLPLAFFAETFMHSMTEPGFDYYAYMPLCLTAILLRYLQYQNPDIRSLFDYQDKRRRYAADEEW